MIRSHTIRNAIEKPELKVVPQVIPPTPAPKEDGKLASAILDMSKSAEQNAAMMREVVSKLGQAEIQESPKESARKWVFEIERDNDMHSPNYGLTKRIIATSE